LRLSDRDFRRLTLRQFNALLQRYKRDVELGNLRAGVIAATVGNFSMNKDPKSPLLRPDHFFSNLKQPDSELELDPEQTLEFLKKAFGATVN
jgi:hypothetical protein